MVCQHHYLDMGEHPIAHEILPLCPSSLLILSCSLLFIFGQEPFKAQSCSNFNRGGFSKFTGRTGPTGLDTGQTA